ncbi:MAG: hypothetical protein Q9227_008701 [Pyrenula ochraceoflavens]
MSDGVLSVSPNSTTNPDVQWSTNQTFFIKPDDSATTQAGFMSSNSTIGSDTSTVTDGWIWYGTQLQNKVASGDGSIRSQFWAVETNQTGLFSLVWNSAVTSVTNGIPVAIKLTPPVKTNTETT